MEPKTEFHTTEISTVRAQKFQQSTELTTKNFNLRHQFSDREPSFSTAVKEAKLWRALYRAYTLTSELGKLNRTTQAMKEFNNKNPFAFFNYPKQMMKLLTKNIL
ncbi:unnamed protein product [Allacma fusca]|uniref:Uncharacterized protein n=1 Tax=Allacma fusca TaxID=39272 RepID=A0A8J2LW01_9HEXA|nr:unnamed protein product [Allacma fusca]